MQVTSAYKQEPSSDKDQVRSFRGNRRRSIPRLKPFRTPYFNVPGSEKASIQARFFLFEREGLNHLIADVWKPKFFIFSEESHPLKQAIQLIFCVGNKLPVHRGFLKNVMDDLLPILRFLGGLYNFCNFVIIVSLM